MQNSSRASKLCSYVLSWLNSDATTDVSLFGSLETFKFGQQNSYVIRKSNSKCLDTESAIQICSFFSYMPALFQVS